MAAIDRGIRFSRVEILDPTSWVPGPAGSRAGGVLMSEDDWVAQSPVPALEFVLAGSLAERQALDHCLNESYYGDIMAWRSGMGALGRLEPSHLDELAGGPFPAVVKRTESWVSDNISRIEAVSSALEASADWTLPEVDVADLAGTPG